jgi:hypothetical protein
MKEATSETLTNRAYPSRKCRPSKRTKYKSGKREIAGVRTSSGAEIFRRPPLLLVSRRQTKTKEDNRYDLEYSYHGVHVHVLPSEVELSLISILGCFKHAQLEANSSLNSSLNSGLNFASNCELGPPNQIIM